MSLDNPDLLFPIMDKNRNEIFIVEYNGFIKNITEGIVIAMLMNKYKWVKKYPQLSKYDNLTNGDIYDAASLYTPEEFLKILSNDIDNSSSIQDDVIELSRINVIQYQQILAFEFALNVILREKFVQKCYIIKKDPFYDYELQYLAVAFNENISKINVISGDIHEAIQQFKPTTCYMNDIDDISKAITNNPDIPNIFFILRNTSKTVYYNETDKLFHYYPEITNKIEEINNTKKYYLCTMYAFKQENTSLNEPVG